MTVTTTTMPARTRPLGVAILAFLVGLFGVLIIIAGVLLMALSSVAWLGLPTSFVGQSGFIWGLIVLILGLIVLGLALGLWHLRMWALVLTLIFVFIELAIYGIAGNWVSLGFILSVIIFVYLLAVSRHFS